jgi:phenylacetic acid degradation operon negative regulatory protein
MTEGALRPRSGSSAKALLLTTLGEFVLPHRGAVWTSTVVRSLGALGVEERNARQALTRLADQGVIRSHRQGRLARWQLTEAGRDLLTSGTERIYGFGAGADAWDGRWLVVLCSVPEEQRAKRHRLRSQLGFAGFGFLAPGVALSPHLDREAVANRVLEDLGLVPGAVVFRAEAGQLASTEDLLARAWDLAALARRYDDFLRTFGRRSPRRDEAQFVALARLVHAWRHFPFVDPEIPLRLLPHRWPGRQAKELFDDRHAAWAPGANRWYEAADGA